MPIFCNVTESERSDAATLGNILQTLCNVTASDCDPHYIQNTTHKAEMLVLTCHHWVHALFSYTVFAQLLDAHFSSLAEDWIPLLYPPDLISYTAF